jgi:hypothetical protein
LGRGLGKGRGKAVDSLELTLSLVLIYIWLVTLSLEATQYDFGYQLECKAKSLFVWIKLHRTEQENINLTITISKYPTNIKYIILGTWGSLGQFNNIYQVITLSAIKLIHYILWRFKLTTFCLSSFIFTSVVAIIEQTQQKY